MHQLKFTKTPEGNDLYFRNSNVSILRLANGNVRRFPQHDYPVVCLRFAGTDSGNGGVDFMPTAEELREFFRTFRTVARHLGLTFCLGQDAPSPLAASPDGQLSVVQREEGFALRVHPREHTRARRLPDGTVELMPRTTEIQMLVGLHNALDPHLHVALLGPILNKPESRRLHWVAINGCRVARQRKRYYSGKRPYTGVPSNR
jgi:hypothetical protein